MSSSLNSAITAGETLNKILAKVRDHDMGMRPFYKLYRSLQCLLSCAVREAKAECEPRPTFTFRQKDYPADAQV